VNRRTTVAHGRGWDPTNLLERTASCTIVDTQRLVVNIERKGRKRSVNVWRTCGERVLNAWKSKQRQRTTVVV
jgi:hypothetical protein